MTLTVSHALDHYPIHSYVGQDIKEDAPPEDDFGLFVCKYHF